MFKTLAKWFKYFTAAFDRSMTKKANLEVRLYQAIEQEKQNHALRSKQAEGVIASQLVFQRKLEQATTEERRLTQLTTAAVTKADTSPNAAEKAKFNEVAQSYALELATARQAVAGLKASVANTGTQVELARQLVAASEQKLRQDMAEYEQLVGEVKAAQLKRSIADMVTSMSGIAPGGTVPTLGQVREEIGQLGAGADAALAIAGSGTTVARMQLESSLRQDSAADILAEIRDNSSPAITTGDASTSTGKLTDKARRKDNA